MASYKIGDLVAFTYPAVHQKGTRAHDRFPQVLILHDNWHGVVHGLNFNYLTDQEINYIKAILNEDFAEEISKKDPHIRQQIDRVRTLSQSLNITSPHDFYVRFVRAFIKPRDWDPYRRYRPEKMASVKIITKREILTGERKDGVFSKFVDKFKNMRGPKIR